MFVPNGISGCFWKRGTPIRKSTEFLEHFEHRVMHICQLLAYFTIFFLICIRNYEGHRCDRNVLLFKYFLISVNAKFQVFFKDTESRITPEILKQYFSTLAPEG